MTQENDDLVLLERVFLGIVMSETDEQFESIINKVLLSVIQKLSSPNESVKNKVIELLSHVSKRTKAAKTVQLPVETLVSYYGDSNASAFIVNFTIIYIKIGFPRLPKEKKFELLPQLISAVNNKPLQHQESLLVLLIASSKGYVYPRDENEGKNLFNLGDKDHLKKLLLSILMDIFMFPYGCVNEQNLTDISQYSYRRLTQDGFLDMSADAMEKTKVECIKMLTSGLYTPNQEYPALVVASGDYRSSVSQLAEDRIKKIMRDIDTNKAEAVTPLYSIYLGSDAGSTPDKLRGSINMRIRLKILQHISKFTVILYPIAIRVLFESLYGSFANQKLRVFALSYASMIIQHLQENHLKQVAPLLLESGFLKLLREPEIEISLKEKTFPLVGQLVRKCPSLVCKDLSLLTFLFDTIEEAGETEMARVIRDSAVSMSNAYGESNNGALPGLLEAKLSSPSQKARSLALNFIINALQPTPLRTYLLLYSTCLSDDEIRREAKKPLYTSGEEKSIKPGNFPALLTLVTERDSEKPHPSLLLKEVVLYLRLCMAADAGIETTNEQISHPSDSSPLISKYLNQLEPELLEAYVTMLFRLLKDDSGIIPLAALVEVIGCLYPILADKHLDKIPIFKKLAIDGNNDAIRDLAAEVWGVLSSRVEPPPFNELQSQILALGHLISRIDNAPVQYLNTICQSINEENTCLAGLTSIALIAQSAKLHLPDSQLEGLVDNLLEKFFKSESNKAKEKAINAVGYLCIAEQGTKLRSKVINKLLESPKDIKDIEVILCSGQCLVSAIMGSDSPLAGDPWSREKHLPQSEGSSGLAGSSVERILSTVTEDRRPGVRQTLCFWLLAITKHCCQIEAVKIKLSDIQSGFIDLLNDNNGLVQEGAGKGLALVYDAGDEKTREDLVKTVVEQLGSGKRLGQVSSETKLFEEGELGETPTGGKLSTYKELCTLASDLNQPDLIYKFMALAHHNAIWNSKKGAAFTVASLAQKAGPAFQEHLPSVLVRLYRYQYDPVGHVRQAMAGIWSSLATQDTVVKYRGQIFDDLLSNLTAREWRVRYSSCRAIADLMRGPAGTFLVEERKDRLPELWTELFRVMDDIHKDTRSEALRTAASLAKICATPVILPVLLEKGITNPAVEVRLLSLATISEMLKKGLPEKDVVKVIAGYLKCELDPRSFVQYVKVGMMEELTGALIDSLKHSVRGGRVSSANFITLLSHHLRCEEIQPFVGKFLGALLPGVKDKNRRIRAEFGSTMGQLLRCAKASSVQRLFERLTTLYLESNTEEEVKWGVTEAVDAAIRHSQDAVEETALPLVFLAKHEIPNEENSNMKRIEKWEEAFKQICPGVGRLTTYQSEIITLLLTAIKSQYWTLKAQGGKSVRTLAEKVTDLKQKEEILQAVLEALEGRVWAGKEALLSPLPYLSQSDGVKQVLLKEVSRGTTSYKSAALTYLAETKPVFSTVVSSIKEAVTVEEKKILEAAVSLVGKCIIGENEFDEAVKICFNFLDKVPGPSLESLSEMTRERSGKQLTQYTEQFISAIVLGLGTRKLATVRRSSLNLLDNLQSCYVDHVESYLLIKSTFDKFSTELETDSDPGVRSRAIDIREKFKDRAFA